MKIYKVKKTVVQKQPLPKIFIVIAFDICSSSNIIEGLTLTDNVRRFEHFLATIQKWLIEERPSTSLDIYKFTGDGWILLLPDNIEGNAIVSFLAGLCTIFKKEFSKQIEPYLDNVPSITGITIGIDKGPLIEMLLLQREYVGRAINVACRLQSAVGDKGGPPSYKALISNQVYNQYFRGSCKFQAYKAERSLKNILDGKRYGCHKIDFMQRKMILPIGKKLIRRK